MPQNIDRTIIIKSLPFFEQQIDLKIWYSRGQATSKLNKASISAHRQSNVCF